MFNIFNKPNKINPEPYLKNINASSQFLNLLKNGDFNQAKITLGEDKDIEKDKIIGVFLENLLKNPEKDDFEKLYKFIESGIINIDEIKNNRFISIVLTNAIQNLKKEKNINAVSRLKNMGLI